MTNRSVQCSRLRLDGGRCTRRAVAHGYCLPCWNLGVLRLKGGRRRK